MEFDKNDEFGNIEVIMLNLAYMFIWAAQVAIEKLDKGLMIMGTASIRGKEEKLEAAANLFKASVLAMCESGKMTAKAEELLGKAAKKINSASEQMSKASNLLEATRAQLEVFDEDFALMSQQNFTQLQRDANELLAMTILYLYNSYCDINTIPKTFDFLEHANNEPVHKYVQQVAKYFLEKSLNLR